MWNLSHNLKELGRHAEALSMLQACVELQEQRLGPIHPYTVAATADLKKNGKPNSNILPNDRRSTLKSISCRIFCRRDKTPIKHPSGP
jgi:hypothetical protein